jgi:GNAT superfamily N-acetyltransferase
MSGGYSPPAPIDSTQDASDFICGREALDVWLKTLALKAEGRTARTYAACDGNVVIGYYCLATGSVTRAAAPGNVRRNAPDPIPVMIIGRLAVDRRYQGRGIGSAMLRDALRRVLQASEVVGCGAVVVHAIDDAAGAFYALHGFEEFPVGSRTMFLPLETLRRAL